MKSDVSADGLRVGVEMNHKLLPFAVIVLGIAALGPKQLLAEQDASQPNIVFVMADDMGMGDTSAYQDVTGNADTDQVHTPNMERLARMGVRFTDAHTPSSRCTSTRYGLLTGRYPWRSRLKHWVLFGAQGDPLIEKDRPTIATMLGDVGYATAMVGKWHVGLRYRNFEGNAAAGWLDADLTKPLLDSPIDHGFDFARFTSRSHGTSGPDAGEIPKPSRGLKKNRKQTPQNTRGPGHVHGRISVSSAGNGRDLLGSGPNAYVLSKLGSRHSDHAIEFMSEHVRMAATQKRPFFLYYPSNSNHGPYTPDNYIGGKEVDGAARTIAGDSMNARYNFIYENDVALGRLIDWLEDNEDPRNPGHQLIDNTILVFTSDNGAEKDSDTATGPFRSHKGSVYEGGHRVPFIACWPEGGVGDGDPNTVGLTSDALLGLQDMYATFAEAVGAPLPDLRAGQKGAEDSYSVLGAMTGDAEPRAWPMFFNDHKQAKEDHAVAAMRLDSPEVGEKTFGGKWKLFFDASFLRKGKVVATELYNLALDPKEEHNLLGTAELVPLVDHLIEVARKHQHATGNRLASHTAGDPVIVKFSALSGLAEPLPDEPRITAVDAGGKEQVDALHFSDEGIGIRGGATRAVDSGEILEVRFSKDVVVSGAAIVAGDGACGGTYQVANHSPLSIYCVDADNDAQDQSAVVSDIGVLRSGEVLRFDSSAFHNVEQEGQWRLQSLTFTPLKNETSIEPKTQESSTR